MAANDYEQAGELKIGQVGIANLRIRSLEVDQLVREMRERVERAPKLFGRAAVIVDFGGLAQLPDPATAGALIDGLRDAGVLPVALAYGSRDNDALAQALDLPVLAKFRAQYERAEAPPAAAAVPAPIHTLREEKITPQPYGVADPSGPKYPRQWDRMLLRIGALIALLIPLLYLAWILLNPKPSILAPVQKELAAFPCSALEASVDEGEGSVKVTGYVSRADDIPAVKQRVLAVQGVKSADVQVGQRIWPHCEVVEILKAYKARNDDGQYGLTVTPFTGHSERFIEGEKITVKVTEPNYEGYLYVDYYTVTGDVAHIFPHPQETESGRTFGSSEQLTIGEEGRGWVVCPPLGQELITVISSPTPLYTEALVESESAKDYLPKLRQMLDANRGNAKLAAAYLFMQTEPAEGADKQAALVACSADPVPADDTAQADDAAEALAEEPAP